MAATTLGSRVHPLAKSAFTLSGSSGLYDRARPSYPPQAISRILSLLPSHSRSATIVELGAGTGIFSRQFLRAIVESDLDDDNGDKKEKGDSRIEKYLAVEPAEGMRIGFKEKVLDLTEFGPKVDCVEGEFGRIPIESGSADLVIAAQAFHWVGKEEDGNGKGAVEEIARVLKPGGHLALIWNLEDRDSAAWVAQVRDAYEPFEQGTPQYRLGFWRHIFKVPAYSKSFVPEYPPEPAPEVYHRRLESSKSGVVERVLSKSYITSLGEEDKAKVVKKVEEVVDNGEGKVWIDESKGLFEYPYKTDLYVFARKA